MTGTHHSIICVPIARPLRLHILLLCVSLCVQYLFECMLALTSVLAAAAAACCCLRCYACTKPHQWIVTVREGKVSLCGPCKSCLCRLVTQSVVFLRIVFFQVLPSCLQSLEGIYVSSFFLCFCLSLIPCSRGSACRLAGALSQCTHSNVCVCVCVCALSSHLFWKPSLFPVCW